MEDSRGVVKCRVAVAVLLHYAMYMKLGVRSLAAWSFDQLRQDLSCLPNSHPLWMNSFVWERKAHKQLLTAFSIPASHIDRHAEVEAADYPFRLI